MAVLEQVQSDVKDALKSGARDRAAALRLIVSELQKAAKDGDGDEVAVLQRERKRRLESAAAYRDGGRDDLAGAEQAEAEMIGAYLPEQLSDDELAAIVERAIEDTGAASAQDMGRVMGVVMPQVKGRADGNRVNPLVKQRLTG